MEKLFLFVGFFFGWGLWFLPFFWFGGGGPLIIAMKYLYIFAVEIFNP